MRGVGPALCYRRGQQPSPGQNAPDQSPSPVLLQTVGIRVTHSHRSTTETAVPAMVRTSQCISQGSVHRALQCSPANTNAGDQRSLHASIQHASVQAAESHSAHWYLPYSLPAIHRQEQLQPQALKSNNEPTKSPGENAGAKSYSGRATASSISHQLPLELCSTQNLIDQLLIRPVSPLALSLTRSFQLPLSASLDRFTVKVCLMSSALPPA